MKNETVLNENVEIEEIDNTEVEVYEMEPEESGGSLLKVAGVIGLCAGVGAAALHFTKKKRQEWKIKSLEKQGYTVTKPEVVEDDEEIEDAEFVESEEVKSEDEKNN